jgi:hypothetical protein
MKHDTIDVLFGRAYIYILGKNFYKISEPSVRQYLNAIVVIHQICYTVLSIQDIAKDTKSGLSCLGAVSSFLVSVAKLLPAVIEHKLIDVDQMTPRQIIHVINCLTDIMHVTKQAEGEDSGGKSKSDDHGLIAIFEKFSSEYGWFPDQILDEFTMRKLYAYQDSQVRRESKELELEALMHGHKLNLSGSEESKQFNREDVDAARQSGIKFAKDEISQNILVNPGDINKLKMLMQYMGIAYPDNMNLKEHENNLRNIVHAQILAQKQAGKWKYPDYRQDVATQVLGVKRGDYEGLIAKAKELEFPVDDSFDIKANEAILRKNLCIIARRRQGYLEQIKPASTCATDGKSKATIRMG